MKKLKFYLSHNLYSESNKAIREKSDIISLLLMSVSEMTIDDSVDKDLGYYEIIVDKMSRIIYTLKKDGKIYKRFSCSFPFYLKKNIEGISKWNVYDSSGSLLNSQTISILTILFNEGLFNENINTDVEPIEFYDRIFEAIKEVNGENDITERLIWHFVRKLFLFEPGYVRYDFDDAKERVDALKHPLHHLDFYFSSNATLKIGIAKDDKDFIKWKEDSFEKMIDIKSPCYYLKI